MEFHKLLGRNPVLVISGEPATARDCKWDLNRSFVGFLRFHNCSVLCIGFYLCAQTLVWWLFSEWKIGAKENTWKHMNLRWVVLSRGLLVGQCRVRSYINKWTMTTIKHIEWSPVLQCQWGERGAYKLVSLNSLPPCAGLLLSPVAGAPSPSDSCANVDSLKWYHTERNVADRFDGRDPIFTERGQ